MRKSKTAGLFTGVIAFIGLLFLPFESLSPQAQAVLAVAALMAIWWMTEAIPIAATALLPIVLFPILGVMDSRSVTLPYANHLVFLFLGGFLIAATIEKWNLHQRIALHTIRLIGTSPDRIILGFMIAVAILSMWISNTAASLMMVTIGLAVLKKITDNIHQDPTLDIDTRPTHFQFGIALMLAIAYGAAIGGIATPIGTPPNAILLGIIEHQFGQRIGFFQWMLFALPISITMLFIAWLYLTRFALKLEINVLPGGAETIKQELSELGKMSKQEKQILMVFLLVASLWICRGIFDFAIFNKINDASIAIAGALLLFILPADINKGTFLLDWKTASHIPWDILILFGGGLTLAQGFSDSGLTEALASQLTILQGMNLILILFISIILVVCVTEMASNTATATLFLPVMAAFSVAMLLHPYTLMTAIALGASFAFMLPVATPPNAIAFSSRYFTIGQMFKLGVGLDLLGIVVIIFFVYFYMPVIWGINIHELPANMQLVK